MLNGLDPNNIEPIHTADSDFYNVTKDLKTGYVYMDPIDENQPYQYTGIFFHDSTDAEQNYDLFKNGEFGPKTRFVFPKAELMTHDQYGNEKYSWY